MLSPYLFVNAGCVYKHGFGTLIVTQKMLSRMVMLILTLILLLISVDFKIHGNITSALMLILVLVLLFLLPILLRMGTVILTLAGIQAGTQLWMLLVRMLYS